MTVCVFDVNAHFLVACLNLDVNFLVEWSPWHKFLILKWPICVWM